MNQKGEGDEVGRRLTGESHVMTHSREGLTEWPSPYQSPLSPHSACALIPSLSVSEMQQQTSSPVDSFLRLTPIPLPLVPRYTITPQHNGEIRL